ncbi:MAG: AI-2E family transporter [Candidatus Eremiobacteraeota bacterium]|nr:AI-2E family transporter [Candidatus Eremiobacteraeota bacterium]MBC5824317.1 AI-2E family transporter [Candidatus Eremiobacteraeota bacterium]
MDSQPPGELSGHLRARTNDMLRILAIIIALGFIIVEVVAFLSRIGYTSIIAIGGVFIAFLVFPAVRWLNNRLPLWLALAIVYVGVLLAIAAALWFVVPDVTSNLQSLLHDLPTLERKIGTLVNDPRNPVAQRLPAPLRSLLTKVPQYVGTFVQRESGVLTRSLLLIVQSAIAIGALFIAVPVVSLYMLAEGEMMKRFLLGVIPQKNRERTLAVLAELEHVVGGFIRGQLVVAAVVGTLVTLLLLGLHVPYAILIGVLAGILDVIPYIGAVAGYLPAAIIALVTNGFTDAIYVTIGFIAINQLEGHLISPRIVSRTVGVTPLAVIFALLVGGELFGLPGLLMAVPVAGVLRVLVVFIRPPQDVPTSVVQPGLSHMSRQKRGKKEPAVLADASHET